MPDLLVIPQVVWPGKSSSMWGCDVKGQEGVAVVNNLYIIQDARPVDFSGNLDV